MSFPIAPCRKDRINNYKYYYLIGKKKKIGIWKEKTSRWLCIHSREGSSCKKCDGISLCEHLVKRKTCIKCRNLYLLSRVSCEKGKHVEI